MMTFEEAVTLLKNIVKYSAVPGQKHLDLTLVNIEDLPQYELALKVVNDQVKAGQLSRDELNKKLGLN